MKAQTKKWLIISSLFIGLGILILLCKLYNDLEELNKAMQPIEYSKCLNFKEIDQTILIGTRTWGLLGDHSVIFITEDTSSNRPNKTTDIIFDRSAIYYKKIETDSLLICMPSMSYSKEEITFKKIGRINVRVNKYKASENNKYNTTYKNMGLLKVTTDKGFE